MFTPALSGARNTSRGIHISDRDPYTQRYKDSLVPVALDQVNLIELLHTVFSDTANATADALPKYVQEIDGLDGVYRDAAGTIVVKDHDRHESRLRLLWPVQKPVVDPNDHTTIGGRDTLFVDNGRTVVPLAAADADAVGFAWGYSGTGPINTYKALIYAVTGEIRTIEDIARYGDYRRPLHRWLVDGWDHEATFEISWPELVARAQEDSATYRLRSVD